MTLFLSRLLAESAMKEYKKTSFSELNQLIFRVVMHPSIWKKMFILIQEESFGFFFYLSYVRI